MDHQKIYNNLIQKAKKECRIKLNSDDPLFIAFEKHHIIPRCIGGTDNLNNLVLLTLREHFVAHKLLTKIHPLNKKIFYAFHLMVFMNMKKYKISSRDYEYARLINLMFPPFEGFNHTKESKIKISKSLKGRKVWNAKKYDQCPPMSTIIYDERKISYR